MKNNKLLIGIIILLVVGFLVQTVYIFQIKKRLDNIQSISSSTPFKDWFSRRKFSHGDFWDKFDDNFDSFFDEDWDPFSEMERIQKEMNRMFRDSSSRGFLQGSLKPFTGSFFDPEVDIRETESHYIVTMDIPGMEKDSINIEVNPVRNERFRDPVDGGIKPPSTPLYLPPAGAGGVSNGVKDNQLIVSGERERQTEESHLNRFFRKEREFGHFERIIPLPDDAKAEGIDVEYEKGVLTVKIPKQSKEKEPQPELRFRI